MLRNIGFQIEAKDWSAEEDEAAVLVYFDLYQKILRGERVNKTQAHRQLQEELVARTEQAIKRKFENISSYLHEIGLAPMPGYTPSSDQRQHVLESHIRSYLETHPEIVHWIRPGRTEGDPEELVDDGLTAAARRTARRGQGYGLTPEQRKAIEAHAMREAVKYFEAQGYEIRDVSRDNSYDLLCSKADAPRIRVEVKGTTSTGATVILTRNEVELAQNEPASAVLFIIHSIRLTQEQDEVRASGGTRKVIRAWCPLQEHLKPLSFAYSVPL